MDEITKQEIREAVEDAFSAGVTDRRFIDVSRVPLICQSIISLSADMKELKESVKDNLVTQDQFAPVRAIVYGLVGLILTGVLGAVLVMLFK